MTLCAECGSEIKEGDRFCSNCGAEVRAGCPVCGAPVQPNAKFCGLCGAALEPESSTDRPEPLPAFDMTERRMVTVLFADLVGFTERSEQQDPEEVAQFLEQYFERSRRVVERFGGVVEKFAGDAVMAVWGAPAATEDDAERAVRAGLELQATVADLAAESGDPSITLRVGINTGEAAVRPGGSESMAMVVGDLVNSAARLQSVADPGTVLVGDSTQRAALRAITFEEAGTRQLKGKRRPIAAWRAERVIAGRRGVGRVEVLDPPFVGRRSELQLLKDMLGAVVDDHRARMVTITGEVGIGKSRLVWELEKYADGLVEPVYWNQGRSPSYGTEGVALWAVSDMLRSRIGVAETFDEATVTAALDDSLEQFFGAADDAKRLREWLLALLCCGPTPDADRGEFDAAIRSYLAGMANHGTSVLVFEDMQWADGGSLDLVEQLPAWIPDSPVLVLALTRPELFERRPRWSLGRPGVTSLRLAPLPDEEMGRLLDGMLGETEPHVRRNIIERSAGVPLYAVELARSVIAHHHRATVDEGSISPINWNQVALPETLQSLIGARIDRLEAADRLLLQDAAILGTTFMIPGLAAVSGVDEADLVKPLERFVSQELLEYVGDPLSPTRGGFRFVQELVREVTRNRMNRERRRTRHLAAARYFESRGGPDDAVVAADHYLCALSFAPLGAGRDEIRDQAAGVLVAAFDRAVSLYAHEEALSLGERIQELDVELSADRAAAMSEQMALAAGAVMRFDEAQQHVGRAIDLNKRRNDQAGVRHGAYLSAYLHLEAFNTADAIAIIEEYLQGVDDLTKSPELPRLEVELARARRLNFDFDASHTAADRALVAGEALGLYDVVVEASTSKAICLAVDGRTAEARRLLESAIELAKSHDLLDPALTAYVAQGWITAEDEKVEHDPDLDAIELGRQVGNLNVVLVASGNRAEFLMARGEWAEVDRLVNDGLWQSAAGTLRSFNLILQAMSQALRGHVSAAQESLGLVSQIQIEQDGAEEAGVAFVRAIVGETRAALAWAQSVLDGSGSIPWIEPLARLLLIAGRRPQIEQLGVVCLERSSKIEMRYEDFVASVVAVGTEGSGSLDVPLSLIADAGSTGFVLDELICMIGLARWLPEDHSDRTRLMTRARRRIEQTGFHGLTRFLDP
jgi:class 3 adenylate cyclase/tetratricopeptide (TPR) repeat protein